MKILLLNSDTNETLIELTSGVTVDFSQFSNSKFKIKIVQDSQEINDISFKFPEPQPTPTPTPVPSGKPSANNTGPRIPLTKKQSGMTVDKNGSVYEGIEFTSDVKVRASNVVFRDCKFKGMKFYDEAKYGSHRNLTVEYCEFSDPAAGTLLVGGHMHVHRCHFHDSGADGINVHANAVITECYITRMGLTAGSHADGISGSSPDDKPVIGVIIRNNNIDMPHPDKGGPKETSSNWCIGLGKFGTKDNPTIIEGNWLNGGNATVNSGIEGAVIMVRNNRFGRQHKKLRQTHTGEVWEEGTWVGNVWDDNGQPV